MSHDGFTSAWTIIVAEPGGASPIGLNGTKATSFGRFEALFREPQAHGGSTLGDVHMNDLIPSRNDRRVYYGEA
jgi:hypothetical protein